MTKEEAIKYIQQLYPNGGHCLLDEQRIDAISMAINALQEEPVSEELEKTSKEYADKNYAEWLDFVSGDERDDHYPITEAFKAGAKWQKHKDESKVLTEERRKIRDDAFELGKDAMKQQLMAKAIDAQCFGFQCGALFSFRLPASNYLVGSEVKVIVIKK